MLSPINLLLGATSQNCLHSLSFTICYLSADSCHFTSSTGPQLTGMMKMGTILMTNWVFWLPMLLTTAAQTAHQHYKANNICSMLSAVHTCTCQDIHHPPDLSCTLHTPTLPLLNTSSTASRGFSIRTLDLSGSDLSNVNEHLLEKVGRIQVMKLHHCNLHHVPQALLQIRGLLSLDLSHNNLTTFSLDTIAHLSIHHLDLAANKLEKVSMGRTYPPKLTNINISHNKISQLPLEMWQISREIGLSHNVMKELPALTKSAKIRALDVSHNKLTQLSVDFLSAAPHLRTLNMAGNHIQLNVTLAAELKMTKLKLLNLSDNHIDHLSAGLLRSTPQLATLDISHNKMTQLSYDSFPAEAAQLHFLDLSHNSLTYLNPATFHFLQRVRHLDLSHNAALSDRGVSRLSYPDHLTSLNLSHCSLVNLDYCQLIHLHDLIHLHLDHNPLRCNCQQHMLYNWLKENNRDKKPAKEEHRPWNCLANDSDTLINVAKLPSCPGSIKCPSLKSSLQAAMEVKLTVNVLMIKHNLIASWKVSEIMPQIQGFRVVCVLPEEVDVSTKAAHISPVLSTAIRSYTLTDLELNGNYKVCVDVLHNQTQVLKRVCQSILQEESHMIVGILAGCVFLAPCLIFVIYIVIKDTAIQNKLSLSKVSQLQASKQTDCVFHHQSKTSDNTSVCNKLETCHQRQAPQSFSQQETASALQLFSDGQKLHEPSLESTLLPVQSDLNNLVTWHDANDPYNVSTLLPSGVHSSSDDCTSISNTNHTAVSTALLPPTNSHTAVNMILLPPTNSDCTDEADEERKHLSDDEDGRYKWEISQAQHFLDNWLAELQIIQDEQLPETDV